MDPHLKVLFARYHEQFGAGPGLGPTSAACLLTTNAAPTSLLAALYRACAALHRSNPWRRLRPAHLLAVRVGKDSDWPPSHRQPFPCAQFVGGDGGDLAVLLFRSHLDAARATPAGGPAATLRFPNLEVLRVTFAPLPLLSPANRRMIRSLSLESAGGEGDERYPVVDVARCGPAGGDLRFRNPTAEELRFVFAFTKAVVLVHPLLRETKEKAARWARSVEFEPFIETLDVQWPPELAKGGRDTVAVTISHPPDHAYEHKPASGAISPSPAASPTKRAAELAAETNGVGEGKPAWAVTRQCAMCEKETPGEQALCCGRCRAVVYCGQGCQKQHWKETHKAVCGLYKAMMDREEELAMKVFVFPCLVEHPCRWLELVGLHQKGMWRRKCACYSHSPFGLLPVKNGALESWGGLGEGEYPPDSPLPNEDAIPNPILLSSWPEYYNLRSLPLSSPVAAILSHPLTVYYILTSLSIGSKTLLHRGREVVVHYLGPECELDWLLAFAEIGHLLNGSGNVLIVMVGPEVPSNLSGTVVGIGSRVRVNLVRGVYQEEVTYLPSPHVIVALNSGLESGLSWGGALEMIKASNVPAFFTDQSELSCANAKQVLRTAGLHIGLPVTPNPFRSPVRNHAPSNNLPSYSNGFVFGVNT